MIPPSYGAGNVRSWSDPVVVPSDPHKRAARARCMYFFSKIYEIPRAGAARALCASSLLVNSTVYVSDQHQNKYKYSTLYTRNETDYSCVHNCVLIFILVLLTHVHTTTGNFTSITLKRGLPASIDMHPAFCIWHSRTRA